MMDISIKLANMPFNKFKKWHEKYASKDKRTAEEAYKAIGGKIKKGAE